MEYINFNDEKIPLGKRKQAYVKYAMSKGTPEIEAKRQANKKFGFEQQEGIFAIVLDWGRTSQRSFSGSDEIFYPRYDLRKYKKHGWVVEHDENKQKEIRKHYEAMGWKVVVVSISA